MGAMCGGSEVNMWLKMNCSGTVCQHRVSSWVGVLVMSASDFVQFNGGQPNSY